MNNLQNIKPCLSVIGMTYLKKKKSVAVTKKKKKNRIAHAVLTSDDFTWQMVVLAYRT